MHTQSSSSCSNVPPASCDHAQPCSLSNLRAAELSGDVGKLRASSPVAWPWRPERRRRRRRRRRLASAAGETVDEIFGLPPCCRCVFPGRRRQRRGVGLLDVISKGLEGVAKECRMRFLVADAPNAKAETSGADVKLTMSYEPTSIPVAAAPFSPRAPSR